MIRITVCKFGEIDIELDYQNAPYTAANFAELARNHFYDGLSFHRIIKGFMIQGGDPRGNGTGGADYNIRGEFKLNGFDNKISHKRGVISMARAMDFDSASSQFFIMHKDGEYLDNQYAAFGKVIKGMDIVDQIANVKTDRYDRPLEKVVIEKIETIDEEPRNVEKIK